MSDKKQATTQSRTTSTSMSGEGVADASVSNSELQHHFGPLGRIYDGILGHSGSGSGITKDGLKTFLDQDLHAFGSPLRSAKVSGATGALWSKIGGGDAVGWDQFGALRSTMLAGLVDSGSTSTTAAGC